MVTEQRIRRPLPPELRRLMELKDITRAWVDGDQTLTYENHIPCAGFIFLRGGALLISRGATSGRRPLTLRAAENPFLIPRVDEMDRPARYDLIVGEKSEILFVPRTLVISTPGVRQLLIDARLPSHSIC